MPKFRVDLLIRISLEKKCAVVIEAADHDAAKALAQAAVDEYDDGDQGHLVLAGQDLGDPTTESAGVGSDRWVLHDFEYQLRLKGCVWVPD